MYYSMIFIRSYYLVSKCVAFVKNRRKFLIYATQQSKINRCEKNNKWMYTTINCYPPASKATKEGDKFKWKKKSTYPRIWCQWICLSVCLSVCGQIFYIYSLHQNLWIVWSFDIFWCVCCVFVFVIRNLLLFCMKFYPDLLHLHGDTKFATQISPLLNLY